MKTVQSNRCGAARAGLYSLEPACAWKLALALVLLALSGCDGSSASTDARPSPDSTATARSATPPKKAPLPVEQPAIVFLGTSLTAGYGLPEDQAFPALIDEKLAAEGFHYRVVNAGVSGDTSAGGLRRLDWLLRLPIAVLVVELGANDMLRGQSVDALAENLTSILDRTRAAHPDAQFVIAGMRAAPNLGPEYRAEFDAIYPDLAARYGATLVPFLLEDVAAKRSLNQADGIHPTARGHELIAERVYASLQKVLEDVPERSRSPER
jgi:acyl-CoA thioesterase-1